MPATMQSCIEDCLTCHRVCVETAAHCLQKGGKHPTAEHIRTLLDCEQMCATSADFMLRGSDLHTHTCAACATVCEVCAERCAQIADDEMMKRCVETCRRCAQSCREMSQSRRAA